VRNLAIGKKAKSELEEIFDSQLRNDGLPIFEREYQFGYRRSRFDFAWPTYKIAAEVEGGSWIGGRHSRGKGFAADCEKYNAAALAEWFVFRFTADQVRDGYARKTLAQAFEWIVGIEVE